MATPGLHTPVIPFADVVVKPGTASAEQIVSVVPNAKVGVRIGLIVTVKTVVVAHRPASGINV